MSFTPSDFMIFFCHFRFDKFTFNITLLQGLVKETLKILIFLSFQSYGTLTIKLRKYCIFVGGENIIFLQAEKILYFCRLRKYCMFCRRRKCLSRLTKQQKYHTENHNRHNIKTYSMKQHTVGFKYFIKNIKDNGLYIYNLNNGIQVLCYNCKHQQNFLKGLK